MDFQEGVTNLKSNVGSAVEFEEAFKQDHYVDGKTTGEYESKPMHENFASNIMQSTWQVNDKQ